MACALAANICLVARFLEKKVKVMTVGCIIFLTIHGKSGPWKIVTLVACSLLDRSYKYHCRHYFRC
jgi:hypothetical protein